MIAMLVTTKYPAALQYSEVIIYPLDYNIISYIVQDLMKSMLNTVVQCIVKEYVMMKKTIMQSVVASTIIITIPLVANKDWLPLLLVILVLQIK